ncbi:MAG: hypothetical protein COA34_008220 [Methylophaga sp.]|uniref:KAP family P-loop NTPase fold protein n=1 Tax=Methylophaga sp. TaxID=2024840 RepID=UPI000C0FB6C5|nr:P-loop NTPase fold protein [Methylophaga sp.]MBL1457832.1 hypothetical protein [Methylophaga sp.]
MDSETKSYSTNDNIWEGDKLGRKQEAQHLLRFLENKFSAEQNVPFVLNIDSSWGHGKTFFITHFAQQLRLHNYPVVVFDAWKNDFSDEALLSFISAVCNALDSELSGKPAAKEVRQLRSYAASLVKPALPILLSALVKQLTGMSLGQIMAQNDEDADTPSSKPIDNLTEFSSELSRLAASKALDVYTEKKNATEGFTKSIENIVALVEKGKSEKKQLPIFVFVDELDRCRPSFSIELLEGIKHLFSASGVYFIVSTDTKQLCHSIKAVYGLDFDAAKYLKRFFDMEYQLETPKTHQLVEYLFESFSAEVVFFIPSTILKEQPIYECFADICDFFKLGARDIEQIFVVIKTAAYLSEIKLHFIFLAFVACFLHKYPNKRYFFKKLEKTKFDAFFAQEIESDEIVNHELKYSDVVSGQPTKITLRNLFGIYLHISQVDLKKADVKQLSSIGRQIATQLFTDNQFIQSGFRDEPPAYDKTLDKYYGLVKQAGKFQG